MRRSLVCSALLVAACGNDYALALIGPQPPPVAGIDLVWSMQRVGWELRVEYTITNHGDRPVEVFDHFLDYPQSAIAVHDAPEPATVAFTHGEVDITPLKSMEYSEWENKRLDPGRSVTNVAVVPIPMKAWLNYTMIKPLDLGKTHAVLEVDCEDADGHYAIVRGRRLPLPDGSMSWIPRPPTIDWYAWIRVFRERDAEDNELDFYPRWWN